MNLYIGNLSYNVKESDLRHVMEEYGTVASVKLITDRETRRSKGFAFIEMPDDAEAAKAIEQLNGAECRSFNGSKRSIAKELILNTYTVIEKGALGN